MVFISSNLLILTFISLRHDTDGLWMRGVQRLRHKVLYGLKSAREIYPDEMMKKSEYSSIFGKS